MTVQLRVKRSPATGARRRLRGIDDAHRNLRQPAPVTQPAAPPSARPAVERIVPPPSQDRALYSCSCGFVFSGEVSTSVACPHCGGTQAW